MRSSAVIVFLAARAYELAAGEAQRLTRYLRTYQDASGAAGDLAQRLARAGQHGHTVYLDTRELPFLLRALEDLPGQPSEAAAELAEELRSTS